MILFTVEEPQSDRWVLSGSSYQKASRLIAARVTEYIGYLEKGQIPPKVHELPPLCDLQKHDAIDP